MNVRRRVYYQYAEKDTYTISLKWKGIHMILFFLIAINSFLAAFAFQSILVTFQNHCVLYAIPNFELQDVRYLQQNLSVETVEQNNVTLEQKSIAVDAGNSTSTKDPDDLAKATDRKLLETPEEPTMELRQEKLWYRNSTMEGRVTIDLRRTIFVSLVMCEVVVFNTMVSLLIGLFFGVLIVVCGRGGRGHSLDILPQPWLYVYPVLIVSSIMTVVSAITGTTVNQGLNEFCCQFEQFTNQKTCTALITYFSFVHGGLKEGFVTMYTIAIYTFNIEIVLWILQLILTILRILCVVDFQLNAISVRCKTHDVERVHEALVQAVPGLKEDKGFFNEEDNTSNSEPKHETTQL